MRLITEQQMQQLLANGSPGQRERDHVPVVKIFDPTGAATWLFTEMEADGDTLFGLCDLGMGAPELGYASLRELEQVVVRFGLRLEPDLYWRPEKTLSQYAEEARQLGRINS